MLNFVDEKNPATMLPNMLTQLIRELLEEMSPNDDEVKELLDKDQFRILIGTRTNPGTRVGHVYGYTYRHACRSMQTSIKACTYDMHACRYARAQSGAGTAHPHALCDYVCYVGSVYRICCIYCICRHDRAGPHECVHTHACEPAHLHAGFILKAQQVLGRSQSGRSERTL